MINQLLKQLRRDEGVKLSAYQDSEGYWTIGIGRLIDARKGGGISNVEADMLLKNDVARAMADLDKHLPWWVTLDEVRRGVVVSMTFNMGIGSAEKGTGLLGFKNTLRAIQDGRWQDAAAGMLASKWATQVGPRATRLAEQMKSGVWV